MSQTFPTKILVVSNSPSQSVSATATKTVNHINLGNVSQKPSIGNSGIVGLIIGLPIGIFCFSLILLIIIFYIDKRRHRKLPWERYEEKCGSTPKTDKNDSWLTSVLYKGLRDKTMEETSFGEIGTDNNGELNISSKVEYRLSMPLTQHILTPKNVISESYNQKAGEIRNQVLISKNFNNITPRTTSGHYLPSNLPKSINDDKLDNWIKNNEPKSGKYPFELPSALDTKSIQLKKLRCLSSAEIEYCDFNSEEIKTAKVTSNANTSNEKQPYVSRVDSINSSISILYPSGNSDNSVHGQVLEVQTPKIDKEFILGTFMKNTIHTNDSKTPKGTDDLRSDVIYRVVENFTPTLDGEIELIKGEFVRVKVSHTDGWCIVEKCNADGTINTSLGLHEPNYLNMYRGIAPGKTLVVHNILPYSQVISNQV